MQMMAQPFVPYDLLDIVFVANFGLGVNGVALATVIAQSISAILCVRRLMKMKDLFDFKLSYMKWKKRYGGGIIRLGLPSGITQAILSMSMILVQSLTNQFGAQFVASNVIVMRVDGFAMLPNFSFGTALTTYVGQNIGAGDMKRVTKGAKQGLVLSLIVSLVLVALILIFGRQLMGIFTNTDELIDTDLITCTDFPMESCITFYISNITSTFLIENTGGCNE